MGQLRVRLFWFVWRSCICRARCVFLRATELVMSLELAAAPDDERREVLQRFMVALQSADPQHAEQQARLITGEIAGRVFRPVQ